MRRFLRTRSDGRRGDVLPCGVVAALLVALLSGPAEMRAASVDSAGLQAAAALPAKRAYFLPTPATTYRAAYRPALASDFGELQTMELPVELQMPLFIKVLSFDRQRCDQAEVVLAIVFQRGFRASVLARDAAVQALQSAHLQKFRLVIIDLERDVLSATLEKERVSVLYVTPLRAYRVEDIVAAANAARVLTMTGVPRYLEEGVAVGVRLQGDRPRLMVSLSAARLGGGDFTAELLKLVEVMP